MLDIKWIRANPLEFEVAMKRRGLDVKASDIVQLDDERKDAQLKVEQLQTRRNAIPADIQLYSDNAERRQQLMDEAREIKTVLPNLTTIAQAKARILRARLLELPNIPLEDVPLGPDEASNIEYARQTDWIPPKLNIKCNPLEHYEIPAVKELFGFETAAKLSGSRFSMLRGPLARMERALGQFMLDLHTNKHGYEEVQSPLVVNSEVLEGTGQLPKFHSDLYFIDGSADGRGLIPTAEVTLTNTIRGELLSTEVLPLRMTALTPCFRSEAGSAGRDTTGLMRQHQFNKVELVSIVAPENAQEEHERMLECAERVLQLLGLHYRVMTLSTGDMGFSAVKTYDIEVWLPGQNRYREISSVSNCGDFQARRMDGRVKDPNGFIFHPHTLNGSGTAVGRALIAVLETYQQDNGGVHVPEVLQPYMGGLKEILPHL